MMKITKYKWLILCLLIISGNAYADSFDDIKVKLKNSACLELKFLSIIESDIFETVDTSSGNLYLSGNKFRLQLNNDTYLQDDSLLYSYSADENQVVIEPSNSAVRSELTFITRLDELYNTLILNPEMKYQLIKKDSTEGDYPDSMTVLLNKEHTMIQRLSYYDINDELNIIDILKTKTNQPCDPAQFSPDFPDTVERIKL